MVANLLSLFFSAGVSFEMIVYPHLAKCRKLMTNTSGNFVLLTNLIGKFVFEKYICISVDHCEELEECSK